jgi:RNA polymerase sigma factor FliA
MPAGGDAKDLMQTGMVGLLEAAQRYDGRTNCSFATFASYRIRGAILDSLRKSIGGSRLRRRRLRDIERVKSRLRITTGVAPTPAAIAEALGISIQKYFHRSQDVDMLNMLSLDEPGPHGAAHAAAGLTDNKIRGQMKN